MKYYLIAGEASGDLHASNLMRALKEKDKEAEFRFFGGDLMQAVGGTLVKHYREMAFMGFVPVLLNLRTIFRNMDICKRDIEAWQPDKVILVDYPGFNLDIAKHLSKTRQASPRPTLEEESKKGSSFRPEIIYYISPKIWAWKEYRIKSIRKYIDRMLCILPFEVEYYKKHNYPVEYVGNPTVDSVADFRKDESLHPLDIDDEGMPLIALLAGSRRQEIKDNLPTMLKAATAYAGYHPVIAGAPGIEPGYYEEFIRDYPLVSIVYNRTYALLQKSTAALVTSGTATLETALLRVPQVVCYKTPIKHIVTFIFKHFFSCKYISLVNLIADRTVVQELFGQYFSEALIRDELGRLLNDTSYRQAMLDSYDDIIRQLGQPGASQQAAAAILKQ